MKSSKCPECGYDVESIPARARKELKQKRQAKDFNISGVARAMGISSQYLSMLEKGHRKWSHKLVHDFLKAIR